MERSFAREIEALRQGEGALFRGEGILAVTKALLQSGVGYVGGYQGAPVSHLLDVLVQARDLLDELGIHLETCTNEAAAAALLGASINYPVRGAVTWKSIVGTNVASDALSNLASSGVRGGAVIVLGEDYGEGASVIQERSHAFALKSSLWLLDPRPELGAIVRTVEQAFELSEASNTPVMIELRIRACHVTGEFIARDNRAGNLSRNAPIKQRPDFLYERLSHPPATFAQEKLKFDDRLPRARAFILERKLNELIAGERTDLGIIVQGGLFNSLNRALDNCGLSDAFGNSRLPILVLNVTHPLVPSQIEDFCRDKRRVLVIEEGSPDYLEQAIHAILRKAGVAAEIAGKGPLPMAGEYTTETLCRGLLDWLDAAPGAANAPAREQFDQRQSGRRAAAALLGGDLPLRPPTFCTGCPERPVFTAIKLAERELGPVHVAGDIGCHALATFEPFSVGQSILGYGMSLASAAGVTPLSERRALAIMGDGGFWHNGLLSGVSSAQFNRGDGVLLVMQNGYSSATGVQSLPSSAKAEAGRTGGIDIERTLRALGVGWVRRVRSYDLARVTRELKTALSTRTGGLKVIIADGECQLARQRRLKDEVAARLARHRRVTSSRFGVDDSLCTGDHSCIRLSGCPSLTLKPNPDPLRSEPVAHVNSGCVGCGHCGEVAHAAILCPSFYRTDAIRNPNAWDRLWDRLNRRAIAWLEARRAPLSQPEAAE